MTTCKSSPEDKLEGFAAGASDYLCKPWIIRELVARVRVWTNNTLIQTEKIQLFELSGLVININSETVIVNGLKINLTPSEYKTLALLARNYGRVISSHEIQKEILNCEPQSDDTELCRVIISRLRNKLGDDPRSPKYIETQTGKGYVFGPKEYLTKPH